MGGIPRYTLVWGARYTLGARYLLKSMVNKILHSAYGLVNSEKNILLFL